MLLFEWNTRSLNLRNLIAGIFHVICDIFVFSFSYCVWKQSPCESKIFPCGEKEICIPDYHRNSFKCKCQSGYTGRPCGKFFFFVVISYHKTRSRVLKRYYYNIQRTMSANNTAGASDTRPVFVCGEIIMSNVISHELVNNCFINFCFVVFFGFFVYSNSLLCPSDKCGFWP